MEQERKPYGRDDLFRMLAAALIEKKPQPPEDWSAAKLDEEVYRSGREYEPDLRPRHGDALRTTFFYLVDFARRMPEWIDLSLDTARVREMCGELADEIEKITYDPDSVIAGNGKLKARLKAILTVQTCLICREETARVIAEDKEAKRLSKTKQPVGNKGSETIVGQNKWRSELARVIFQKASRKSTEKTSPQPSLF